MNSHFSLTRRGLDVVSEELVAALLLDRTYDFKELFTVIYSKLQKRKVSGGEEMMRLRAYDKLQGFVLRGQVEKKDKSYRGLKKALEIHEETLKSLAREHLARLAKKSA